MEEKVFAFLKQHQLLQKNKTVLVGVSGGPDSIALLHFFKNIRARWQLRLIAVTVDHQLRDKASQADVAYVTAKCKAWHIPLLAETVDVLAYEKKYKANRQVAARTLRYQVYAKQMKAHSADYLALGHHGDDQIESMVMSLMRTTSLGSLVGIPLKRSFAKGQIIRPLLAVTKEEIEAYCLRHNLEPRIDASNEDTYYTRNYVRKYIVPKLKEKNNQLHQTVQRLSESLADDEKLLMSLAQEAALASLEIDYSNRTISLKQNLLQDYPKSLQRRVYRIILGYLYDEIPNQLTYQHEQIFLSLLQAEKNRLLHFPQDLYIEKSYEMIYFYFKNIQLEKEAFSKTIHHLPDTIFLPNGDKLHILQLDKQAVKALPVDEGIYSLPETEVKFPLVIRNRQDGDRMQYEGLQGTKKIKDILIDEKIPRKEREQVYIVADQVQILWLVNLRKNRIINNDADDYIVFQYEKNAVEHHKEEKDA